ncbi:MAG: threonine efflux protein [bacterium]|jgi:threonine efflux protein
MSDIYEPLLLACAAYIIATATPGPATILIATTSMRSGRKIGLATALGVLCGSLMWGLLAAGGIAAALSVWTPWTQALRVAGGLYLLWLSFKSIRSVVSKKSINTFEDTSSSHIGRAFGRGLLVHLTNPKAVFSWMATVAIGTSSAAATPEFAFLVVAVCWSIGVTIFCGYAIAFASPSAAAYYLASRRKVDALAATVFGVAGLMLLTHRN